MARAPKGFFLPEAVEHGTTPWDTTEVAIREAQVDLNNHKAWVPRAFTPAQKLARLHELGHVKYTPRNWKRQMAEVMAAADERTDPSVILRISKMLEENRIDWLLWDRHQIDLRPAREVLDWKLMPVPSEPLPALQWVLQLAWTVWASRGLSASIPNRPPEREPDPATGDFFDSCWAVLADHHLDLTPAVVRGCLAMYTEPTHDKRNAVAAELAVFFPPKEELEEQPPEKEEEKEAQEEAEQEEKELEDLREERETEPASAGDPESHGNFDIHDHTANIKRTSVKIRRRETPTYAGIKLTYPHRYMLDKAVFALRTVTEGGIMVDGSASMKWDNDNLKLAIEKLPAVTVGIYYGINAPGNGTRPIWVAEPNEYGRICILAKGGKFSKYEGLEPGYTGGNSVDAEALELLAKWPKPRLWLSDGIVCGGKKMGPHPDKSLNTTEFMQRYGNLVYECNKLMLAHEIYRVPNIEVMEKLLKRQRVTLFRTVVNKENTPYSGRDFQFPKEMQEAPVTFQL